MQVARSFDVSLDDLLLINAAVDSRLELSDPRIAQEMRLAAGAMLLLPWSTNRHNGSGTNSLLSSSLMDGASNGKLLTLPQNRHLHQLVALLTSRHDHRHHHNNRYHHRLSLLQHRAR